MEILLDTNYILYYNFNKSKIPIHELSEIENRNNTVFISFASWFEIGHLVRLKKIDIGMPIDEFYDLNSTYHGFELLNISSKHLLKYSEIVPVLGHKDPFDLMIVSQALADNLVVFTTDSDIPLYF